MKAVEILNRLIEGAYYKQQETCDKIIFGTPEKEVNKVAVCFKLTSELADKARKGNFDMIITHEPTFARGDFCDPTLIVDQKKWELLEESGITVARFHDHAHNYAKDYIHEGFLNALELHVEQKYERESMGVCRYVLKENLTVRELAKLIQRALHVDCIRLVGKDDIVAKTVCLGLGSVGIDQIKYLIEPGCDLFITGEVGEVCTCNYIKDACYFGENKAILVLGHCSSEYEGMRLLAEDINKNFVPAEYLHCGEVFKKIED
jgi:putative NIF3 family GTP cyclohydrolase 1 type 2